MYRDAIAMNSQNNTALCGHRSSNDTLHVTPSKTQYSQAMTGRCHTFHTSDVPVGQAKYVYRKQSVYNFKSTMERIKVRFMESVVSKHQYQIRSPEYQFNNVTDQAHISSNYLLSHFPRGLPFHFGFGRNHVRNNQS